MRKLILVGIVLLAFAGIGAASAAVNLVKNGGFETPVNAIAWDVYPDSTPFLEWHVELGLGSPDPVPSTGGPTLEIQREDAIGLKPSEGFQFAELDSYANVKISQMITLSTTRKYHISFNQSCRDNDNGLPSILGVYLNDALLSRTYCGGTSNPAPLIWTLHTIDVIPGADGPAKLTFADEGISNSYGVLLDDVRLEENGVKQVPIPEFPAIALPVGFIVGVLGAVFYIRSTREQ
jgi:hypothetical protein